jgi:antirestriction protein ArdC
MTVKGDRRAIFTAARHAQRGADYLNQLQPAQAQEAAA